MLEVNTNLTELLSMRYNSLFSAKILFILIQKISQK
jgi:hypothetical protein